MDDYLTIKDAAIILNVRKNTLLRQVQRGAVKGKKVGWIWLVHREELSRIEREKAHANR